MFHPVQDAAILWIRTRARTHTHTKNKTCCHGSYFVDARAHTHTHKIKHIVMAKLQISWSIWSIQISNILLKTQDFIKNTFT